MNISSTLGGRPTTVAVPASGPGRAATKKPKPPKDPTAEWARVLSTGFVLVTGLLTAVGGYTGGIGRILRNDPWRLALAMIGIGLAVALGVVATQIPRINQRSKRELSVWEPILTIGAIVVFLAAMGSGITAAAYSSTLKDRPSLSAHLVRTDAGGWSVRGEAATSGLASADRLQILVYGVPSDGGDPVRIYFATTGPDPDGIVAEQFEAPLPDGAFDAFVATANTGTLPRDCAGNRAFYVQSDPAVLKEAENFVEEWQNACVTFAPPGDG
ncbi:hypothetical protein CLV56_3212 [Mumia flava]|uniref:Uncharacterized protein n=1 Tax=Mumia flava TaxID=1348852 RepID=A0A0B2BA04_9ACTN|nr:hypothetical protein [Mumia flava]PJJ53720.1 hypothetical protein CLV56_3212 [Mumia flava]